MSGDCDLVITDQRHVKQILLRPQHPEGASDRGLEVVPLEEKLVCHPPSSSAAPSAADNSEIKLQLS